MKLNNLFYVGALSALALTGCKSNDDNSEWLGSDGIMFTSYIEGLTSRASGSAWDDGDKVGIFMTAGAEEFENREYTASAAGALTPAGSALKWPEGVETADFLAYYPYTASLNGKTYAVDVTNQDDPKAIDLLYSNNATGVANGNAVNLAFKHQLSQIVITVGKDETIASTSGLAITISGMNTKANFDLTDGSLTATDSKANIAMNVNEEGTLAEAIILPTADLNGATMTFTLGSMTFEWPITVQGGQGFEASTKYTYTATLSTVNGQPVVSMGNATIEDWNTEAGGDINVGFEEGEAPSGEEFVALNATFADGMDGFIIDEVSNTASQDIWTQDPSFGNISAKAFIDGANHASESWLISSPIDLTQATTAVLTFEHALGYAYGQGPTNQTLQVKKDGESEWQQLSFTYPAQDNASVFISSGDVDLTAYAGSTIQIAFKYVSTTENAATWRIKNVKVIGNPGGGSVEPGPDPTPGKETVIFEETFGTPVQGSYWPSVDAYDGWDNSNLTFSDPYMTESYSRANVRSTSSMDGHVWFSSGYTSALHISGLNTSNYTDLVLSYSITGNAAGTADLLTVTCGDEEITVPPTSFTQNSYVAITLEDVPDNITSIEFKADAATNTMGLRLDNVKLTGVAK